MKKISFLLLIAIFFLIALIGMNSGAFRFFSINPNFLLAFFAMLIAFRVRTVFLLFILVFLVFLAFSFFSFWILEYVLLSSVSILLLLFRSKLTGNALGDTCILSFTGSILFSICLWFFSHSSFTIYQVGIQAVSTSVWGGIGALIMRPFLKHAHNSGI